MISEKLIPALRESADRSPEALKRLAAELGLPLSHVAGIASFYSELCGLDDGKVDLNFANGGKEGAMFAPADYGKTLEICKNSTDIIGVLRAAGLVGRGGSAYNIADKWIVTKNAPGEKKYIICNGSEGEGETYKDMKLMLRAPHAILQGMLLCAAAIGAAKGFVYVRSEYPECFESMKKTVSEAELGGFEIEVVKGAGAYVCGEETALIRSIVGKRGEPTLKPPYPGINGIFHKPTVINNAETFAAVSEYFLSGEVSKLFTVSGCVERPGVYELPYGVSVKEIAKLAGAGNIKGFRLGGGCTGRIYSANSLGMKLEAGTSLGTASLMFFGDAVSAREICTESVEFLAQQSCGMCTPCRFGSVELAKLLKGCGNKDEIKKLCAYLRLSSRCGLGQSIPNTVESAMAAFPEEFE